MNIRIRRRRDAESTPYWQTFTYDGPLHVTVSAVLDTLNYADDLFDIEGHTAPRIRWECSCMQTMCGGCAMVINGTPALACGTFLDELRGDEVVLEPLSKFPVIADLIVDRSIIYESLNEAQAYLHDEVTLDEADRARQYAIAKCLKCGLCLEVCPNYGPGGPFFGPILANESYLLSTQNPTSDEVRVQYNRHFESGCSKSLSCRSICPMQIETLSSILTMNRKRKQKK